MKKLSLKVRITLWYTGFLVVLVALTLGFMLSISGQVVEQDAKKRLELLVDSNTDQLDWDDGALETEEDFVSFQNGISVFVFSDSGELLLGADHEAQGYPDLAFADRSVRKSGDDYVYDRQVQLEEHSPVWLRGVCLGDSAGQTGVVDTIVKLAFLALPGLVLLMAVGGYLIARKALRPAEQIQATAAEISKGSDLSRRIGLEEGGDEIHQLAQTFDRMLDRLEESFVAEQQFTSDASHELRTPTAVILAQCEYALEAPRTTEDYVEALETVQRQGNKMSRLIAQLLAFTRLEQGTQALQFETLDLSRLTAALCSEQEELAQKGIRLERFIAPDITVLADEALISRLLTNLISNGFQYGRQDGYVRVTLEREGSLARLAVADNGVGIPPEELPKIWRRFYQVNSARSHSSSGSAGLGLAMVEQIARLHGGTVRAESRPDVGSTFIFTLPIKN